MRASSLLGVLRGEMSPLHHSVLLREAQAFPLARSLHSTQVTKVSRHPVSRHKVSRYQGRQGILVFTLCVLCALGGENFYCARRRDWLSSLRYPLETARSPVLCRFECVVAPDFGLHGTDAGCEARPEVEENVLLEVAFSYVFAYDALFQSMEVKNALDKRN